MTIEERLGELGVELPELEGPSYYGATYGKMKPYHRVGNILFLSGHVPDVDDSGDIIHPGALGDQVTLEQGCEAARITGINCLAGLKQAVGDLDNVVTIVRTLNFVVCVPGFPDVHKVSSGLTDLFAEVFGPERGIGCRATIGVTALARNNCFETWLTAEVR
jgi:enamine deaminase RidA (YjgF/YER057c/UK114 family)